MAAEFDEALDAEMALRDEYVAAHTITIDNGRGMTLEMVDGQIVGITIMSSYSSPFPRGFSFLGGGGLSP